MFVRRLLRGRVLALAAPAAIATIGVSVAAVALEGPLRRAFASWGARGG
jgi:hypothetical protein